MKIVFAFSAIKDKGVTTSSDKSPFVWFLFCGCREIFNKNDMNCDCFVFWLIKWPFLSEILLLYCKKCSFTAFSRFWDIWGQIQLFETHPKTQETIFAWMRKGKKRDRPLLKWLRFAPSPHFQKQDGGEEGKGSWVPNKIYTLSLTAVVVAAVAAAAAGAGEVAAAGEWTLGEVPATAVSLWRTCCRRGLGCWCWCCCCRLRKKAWMISIRLIKLEFKTFRSSHLFCIEDDDALREGARDSPAAPAVPTLAPAALGVVAGEFCGPPGVEGGDNDMLNTSPWFFFSRGFLWLFRIFFLFLFLASICKQGVSM